MTRMERRRIRIRNRRLKIAVAVVFFLVFLAAVLSDARWMAKAADGSGAGRQDAIDAAVEPVIEIPTPSEEPVVEEEPEIIIPEPEPTPEPVKWYTERDVIAGAQMMWGEGRGVGSLTEMAAMLWNAANRLDSGDPFYANCHSIYDIITQKGQYHGYSPDNPIEDHLVELARDVLDRWSAEKNGETDVGRVLPAEYLFFYGDGKHNHFTTEFRCGVEYTWYLESPYET